MSVYIRFCGNGYLGFRPYGGSLLNSAKVSKTLLPHHSAPRLGSACPHSGIAPWARREGPSMAQRGYPGIHAGMPTPQCLRSASVVNGAPKSTSSARRPDSRPDFGRTRFSCGSEPARDSGTSVASRVDGLTSRAGSLPHWDRATPARDRSAVRPLSRASFAPTGPAQQIRWVYTRKKQAGCQAASLLILIWGAPLTTLAERRYCGVGTSAWMPR